MQSIGISALQDIRKIKGFENAIIAGGFVRDSVLEGEPSDIDIFVPVKNIQEFTAIINNALGIKPKSKYDTIKEAYSGTIINNTIYEPKTTTNSSWDIIKKDPYNLGPTLPVMIKELGPFTNLSLRSNKNGGNPYKITNPKGVEAPMSSYLHHYDGKYMNVMDCDIIAVRYDGSPEEFGKKLLEQFSYGIDQIYFDGSEIFTSIYFDRDKKFYEATLLSLPEISYLPKAMNKYFKFKNKYPNFVWRTDILQLKGETENNSNTKRKPNFKIKKFDTNNFNINW